LTKTGERLTPTYAVKKGTRYRYYVSTSLITGAFLLAGKGYDTDAFRAFLKDQKIKPVIPGKSNRKKRIRHDKSAGKNRNVIARCLGRLKDFRRIATRYDKLAGNFFSALCLVAIVAYWL
jgi:transposase